MKSLSINSRSFEVAQKRSFFVFTSIGPFTTICIFNGLFGSVSLSPVSFPLYLSSVITDLNAFPQGRAMASIKKSFFGSLFSFQPIAVSLQNIKHCGGELTTLAQVEEVRNQFEQACKRYAMLEPYTTNRTKLFKVMGSLVILPLSAMTKRHWLVSSPTGSLR